MKVKKVVSFWNKMSSTGYKWSSLNAPSKLTPVSHPIWGESLFLLSFRTLGASPMNGTGDAGESIGYELSVENVFSKNITEWCKFSYIIHR